MNIHRCCRWFRALALIAFFCIDCAAVQCVPVRCGSVVNGHGHDWPMLGQNPALTFSTNETLHFPLQLKWKRGLPKGGRFHVWVPPGNIVSVVSSYGPDMPAMYPPIVVGNCVIIGTASGKVLGIDRKTGNVIWTLKFPSCIGTFCSDGDRLFLSTGDRKVFGFDLRTRRKLWSRTLHGFSFLTVSGRTLFGGSLRSVFAMRVDDGSTIWSQPNNLPRVKAREYAQVQSYQPLVAAGLVFVPTPSGHLVARHAFDGRPVLTPGGALWTYIGEHPEGMRPTSTREPVTAYAANSGMLVVEPRLAVFRLPDLSLAWKRGYSYGRSFYYSNVCLFEGQMLACFHRWLGRISLGIGPGRSCTMLVGPDVDNLFLPVVAGGALVYWEVDGGARLRVVRLSNFQQLWSGGKGRYRLNENDNAFASRPVVARGMLFFVSEQGVLYAYESAMGTTGRKH